MLILIINSLLRMPAVYVNPVPIRELHTDCPIAPGGGVLLFRGWGIAPMFEELWSEIADAPGEIFDVIEYKEEWEKDDKFDVEGYIKGNTDYWWLLSLFGFVSQSFSTFSLKTSAT